MVSNSTFKKNPLQKVMIGSYNNKNSRKWIVFNKKKYMDIILN
jgi:hypothetical protein